MAGVYVSIIGAMCIACQSIVLNIIRTDKYITYIGTNPKCTVVGALGFHCGSPMAELEAEEIDTIFDSHKTERMEAEDQ